MKKIFSFVLGLFAVTALQAANTEVARITLTGNGGTESSNVILRVDPSIAADETTSFFGATDEDGQVNIYAYKADKFSAIKSNEFENLELQVITNRRAAANQHYTLTFTVPTSTNGLKLYDRLTGVTTNLTNNGTYEFDVNTTLHPDYVEGANYTIVDRFIINYVAPAPAAPSICFNYNVLEINAHAGESLVVKNGATEIANVASLPAVYSLDLTTVTPALPENTRLVVTLAGQDYQIDYKPAVTPAN